MTTNGLKELKQLANSYELSLSAAVVLYTNSAFGFLGVDNAFQIEFDELVNKGFIESSTVFTDKAYEFLSLIGTPEVRMFNEFMQLIPTSDKFATYARTTALRSKFSKTLLKDLYTRVVKSGVAEEIILQKFSSKVEELKRTSYLCNNLTKWSPYKTLEEMLSSKDNGVINRSSENIL